MRTNIVFLISVATTVALVNQTFALSNRKFSAAIYKKIHKTGNFLVSPFAAQTILALTQSGSEGKTAEQIRRSLKMMNDSKKIDWTFGNLLPLIQDDKKYLLDVGNKLYIEEKLPIKSFFKTIATDIYQAEIENIDFSKKEEATTTINNWVKNKTKNKINNLIDSLDLDRTIGALFVNTLYFKANWSEPFLKAYNKKLDFHRSSFDQVKIDMMILSDKYFNYFESSSLDAKFLELPFKGQDASMVIVLPNTIDGLPLLESKMKKVLKPYRFNQFSMRIIIPKFRLETTTDFTTVLKKMGVTKVFDKNQADLSGIAGEKGDLVIDKIKQKTFIDVSEEGVEAAAAQYILTAIPMIMPPEPKYFRADHPFLFYIKVKNVIVFIGRVTDPQT